MSPYPSDEDRLNEYKYMINRRIVVIQAYTEEEAREEFKIRFGIYPTKENHA